MIIKFQNKTKSFTSLKEALDYCAECTCFLYYISIKEDTIVASGNGVEFKVGKIIKHI